MKLLARTSYHAPLDDFYVWVGRALGSIGPLEWILIVLLAASVALNLWQWFRGPRQFNIDLNNSNNEPIAMRKGDFVYVTFGNQFMETKDVAPDVVSFSGLDDFSGGDVEK